MTTYLTEEGKAVGNPSSNRHAAMWEMARNIKAGNGPLDRIEQFCRERKITCFCDFIDAAEDGAPDLAEWANKPGRGVSARLRGIEARIAKVRREIGR